MGTSRRTPSVGRRLALAAALLGGAAMAAPEPRVAVENVRTVVSDGNHNAFTDLCRFRDRLYLTFRSCPDGHMVFTTSRIRVLSSPDGREWTPVYEFQVPDRDTRDPHFLVFRDTLFVYTGTWLYHADGTRDINEHLGYAAWSADGSAWQGPRQLEGTYGHYVWRAAAFGDRAYLCGRRRHAYAAKSPDTGDGVLVTESALLESEDGLVWRYRGLFQTEWGDETAFLFEPDGAILAVARGGGNQPAQVCRARPPYAEFARIALDRNVGGPLLARWGDRLLVGGRKTIGPAGPKTCLYWLVDDRLVEFAELPSGGDCSYPGFVALDATRALVSWYSSHEGKGGGKSPAAVYLADLRLEGSVDLSTPAPAR